jgi:hypothetical protein
LWQRSEQQLRTIPQAGSGFGHDKGRPHRPVSIGR